MYYYLHIFFVLNLWTCVDLVINKPPFELLVSSFELYSIAFQKKKRKSKAHLTFLYHFNKSFWYLVRAWCYQLDPVKMSISLAVPLEKSAGTELYYSSSSISSSNISNNVIIDCSNFAVNILQTQNILRYLMYSL